MTRTTLRRASAAAVAVLALASLAACGGDDEGDGDATSTESSDSTTDDGDDPDASKAVDGEQSDDDADVAEDSEDEGDEIEPSEFIDVYLEAMDKATTATLEMSFAGTAAVEGTGSADFTTTPPSMKLVIADPSTGQNQNLIIVDGIMYLGMAPEQYIEYDLSDPNSPLGTDLTDQLDPRAMAEVFEEGITRSAYVGEEKVEGESMEHYTVTLDSAALLDEAKLPSGAPTPDLEEIDFDLWFDQDGMVRRQETDLGTTSGAVVLSYDNWGEPVDITKPLKSQITRLPGQG